jgi:hypothetical protein
MKSHPRQLQERKTFTDVQNAQNELLLLIDKKTKEDCGLSDAEQLRFRIIYPWAVMSHGSNKFFYRNPDGRITEFRNISEFVEEIMHTGSDYRFIILLDGPSNSYYCAEFKYLWKALRKDLCYLFPYAREEALHMSAEAPTREEATAYKFSKDEKL